MTYTRFLDWYSPDSILTLFGGLAADGRDEDRVEVQGEPEGHKLLEETMEAGGIRHTISQYFYPGAVQHFGWFTCFAFYEQVHRLI